MNLAEFMDKIHEAGEAEAKRRCKIGPNPSESEKIRARNKAPFMEPKRKKIISELEIKPGIDVVELVKDTAEYIASIDYNIPLYLKPGEYNDEGILRSTAKAFMDIYAQRILGISYDPGGGTVHVQLVEDVDKITRFKSTLETGPDGKYIIDPQEAAKLRDALSESIIDVRAYIRKLENHTPPPGQYL